MLTHRVKSYLKQSLINTRLYFSCYSSNNTFKFQSYEISKQKQPYIIKVDNNNNSRYINQRINKLDCDLSNRFYSSNSSNAKKRISYIEEDNTIVSSLTKEDILNLEKKEKELINEWIRLDSIRNDNALSDNYCQSTMTDIIVTQRQILFTLDTINRLLSNKLIAEQNNNINNQSTIYNYNFMTNKDFIQYEQSLLNRIYSFEYNNNNNSSSNNSNNSNKQQDSYDRAEWNNDMIAQFNGYKYISDTYLLLELLIGRSDNQMIHVGRVDGLITKQLQNLLHMYRSNPRFLLIDVPDWSVKFSEQRSAVIQSIENQLLAWSLTKDNEISDILHNTKNLIKTLYFGFGNSDNSSNNKKIIDEIEYYRESIGKYLGRMKVVDSVIEDRIMAMNESIKNNQHYQEDDIDTVSETESNLKFVRSVLNELRYQYPELLSNDKLIRKKIPFPLSSILDRNNNIESESSPKKINNANNNNKSDKQFLQEHLHPSKYQTYKTAESTDIDAEELLKSPIDSNGQLKISKGSSYHQHPKHKGPRFKHW